MPRYSSDGSVYDRQPPLNFMIFTFYISAWFPSVFNWIIDKLCAMISKKGFPNPPASLGTIATTIQNEVSNVNSAIRSAIDAINRVNPFSDITAPQFDVPDLSSLQNIQLPTGFQDALTRLNSTIPSVEQLKDAIQDV